MKKAKRKPVSRAEAWRRTRMVLASNNVQPSTPKMANTIMLPAFLAIDALRAGSLQTDKFAFLVQMNTAALCLCNLLHENGTEKTKAAMDERIPTIYAAADAFGEIGTRWQTRGRFVATGDELATIRAATQIMASLAETAPNGFLLRALREAEAIAADFYAQQSRPTV